MLSKSNSSLVLNIAPVTFSSEELVVGRFDYTDEESYREVRERYWQTHAFRYDSRSAQVFNVTLVPDVAPIGQTETVNLQDHLLLVANAVQRSILIWIAGKRPILKGGKQLVFWGQTGEARLLTQALEMNELDPIPGLE